MVIVMTQLKGIENLFRNSKLDVIKHRLPLFRISDGAIDRMPRLKVVPFEAISALSKIMQRDIKNFVETHIESHICTNLLSLCRDYPYRIKYSVYLDYESLLTYSECVDVEVLFTIVFGDIIGYMEFIEGHRDGIPFKCGLIPSNLLTSRMYNMLNSVVGFTGIKISSRYTQDIINELIDMKNEITEVILVIPCLNLEVAEIIKHIIDELLQNPLIRIFLIISPPSIYNARNCGPSYKEFFVRYVEITDFVKERYNVYLCSSEANNFEIIVNRSTYLSSYSLRFSLKSEFIPIWDHQYIDNYTLKYLRDCLCSSYFSRNKKHST